MENKKTDDLPVEPDEKDNPHSFTNIFKEVIACTRRNAIPATDIYRLIPNDQYAWCSQAQFIRQFEEVAAGEILEGIMSKPLAEGILEGIKTINGRTLPAKRTKERFKPAATPTHAEAAATASLSPFFTSLVTTQTAEPEIAEADEEGALFDFEQLRARISEILEATDLTPHDVYEQMSPAYKTPEIQAQVEGWFDGTVKQSPKALVTAFFEAAIRIFGRRSVEIDKQKASHFPSVPSRDRG